MDRSIILGIQNEISAMPKSLLQIIGAVPDEPDRSWLEVPIGTKVYQQGSAVHRGCLANAPLRDGSLRVSLVLNVIEPSNRINADVDT
jgi:hypothetical protein